MKAKLVTSMALAATITSGCMTEDDPNRRAKMGAIAGAIGGAVIGHQIQGEYGRYVGAAVGALAGGAVGNYMDRQHQELRRALENELRAEYVTLERIDKDTIKLSLSSEASFDIDSSTVKSAFKPALNRVASVMGSYDQTVIHIVGHTDNTGSAEHNLRLSQRRADSVASYLSSHGVSYSRLLTYGHGEDEPRATNSTEYGRKLNRRVELYINALVQGREQDARRSPY